ncbi:MAG: glycoside hydrolase family 78 protein [Candidatus Helarchaeota archaeon]
MAKIEPAYLRCEYLVNPLGIDVLKPRLSWIIKSTDRSQIQTAYHLLVASSEELLSQDQGDLWDTGIVKSEQSIHIEYNGKPLQSRMFCYWKVRVWDKDDVPSEWSPSAFWSMGLLTPNDWKAKWIGPPKRKFWWLQRKFPKIHKPCPLIRRQFSIEKAVKRALVYVTALGEYELHLNGRRIGDHLLAPEWTDYDIRVQYQTYDVTALLQQGTNVIGAVLGEGWYAGHIGLEFLYNHSLYGMDRRILLQLVIEYGDGTCEEILSDADWKMFLDGPIRKSDHFKGETYDLQKEVPGWDRPNFDDSEWRPVVIDESITKTLVAQMNEPIRIVKELNPVNLTEPKLGLFIYDLGQNIAGWCKIRLGRSNCQPNAIVTLKHAEMLKEDGKLYRRNLKMATATERYHLTDLEDREYHPHFTYHGFQFVGVKGLKEGVKPSLEMLKGCAIASDTPIVGEFESSDPMLNKLWQNILWTQRNNLISVPTDCPQRDERLGWMGDALVFCQTSIFNMDMAAFYTKWVRDIRDAQFANGSYADISPNTRKRKTFFKMGGAPAWTDAGVFVPWLVYLNYGDTRLLQQHYDSMKRFIDYVHSKNSSLIWRKGNWGIQYNDWLNGDTIKAKDYPKKGAEIPKDVFATCFFAQSTRYLAKMAKALNLQEDYRHYTELAQKIREAFVQEFVGEDNRIKGDNQSTYALALHFDMLPEELRPYAVQYLIEAIERYDKRISTGFCTTLPMMLELTKNGYNDLAYQLLQSHRFPSWYYMIEQGATTMWERWDGYVKGRGFQSWLMNSFDHYAIGAVGEWIYRVILGINPDEEHPGFKHFIIHPRPGGTLTWAKGSFNSIYGTIAVKWELATDIITIEVTIPANTTATIYIPATKPEDVTEGGTPLDKSEDIEFLIFEKNYAQYRVGSGQYSFQSKLPSSK